MTYIIRGIKAAGVAIITMKLMIFAADDSAFVESEALEPLEKDIGWLIDESIRYRNEREEEHEAVPEMAAALSRMVIRAILCAKNGVCRIARSAKKSASSVLSGIAVRDTESSFAHRFAWSIPANHGQTSECRLTRKMTASSYWDGKRNGCNPF